MKPAYYNEIDSYCAQWLRNLIAAGHIAPGDVDERDIRDVRLDDLRGYVQCHFFAGIGVWSAALRLAGWPDDRPVWTGSCPCQPFSAAGRGDGFADERHLWPHWFHLIGLARPVDILGEQVASPDGRAWVDLVRSDLEGSAYTGGSVVTTSAGVGAPHGRHRVFFMAHPDDHRLDALERGDDGAESRAWSRRHDADRRRGAGRVADAAGASTERHRENGRQGAAAGLQPGPAAGGVLGDASGERGEGHSRADAGPQGEVQGQGAQARRVSHEPELAGADARLGDADGRRRAPRRGHGAARHGEPKLATAGPGGARFLDHAAEQGLALWRDHQDPGGALGQEGSAARDPGPVNGFWSDAEWVLCRDPQGPRWRPIEPGSFPVADGAAARVGRLRAYGNAINPEQAAAFIRCVMELRP